MDGHEHSLEELSRETLTYGWRKYQAVAGSQQPKYSQIRPSTLDSIFILIIFLMYKILTKRRQPEQEF